MLANLHYFDVDGEGQREDGVGPLYCVEQSFQDVTIPPAFMVT